MFVILSYSYLCIGNQIVKNLFYDDMQVDTIHGLSSTINNASFYNISENGWVNQASF